ncbi:MAG: hypothetical protein VX820_03395 [Candidatus Neomarinimicrobiota bacterium]|nr:hypothetical protein [Candidatus Neomarinimicrobiota bacterium]|tara:strand:+ start:314 stop:553 length:240 start_codon:yes stop_codon:yes gene_type:complete
MHKIKLISLILCLINLAYPCAVCYGNPDSPLSHGMNKGVLTLMGFIIFILMIILYSIISMAIRTKKIKITDKGNSHNEI